jgi:phosphate starvation-inducible protein PhoH
LTRQRRQESTSSKEKRQYNEQYAELAFEQKTLTPMYLPPEPKTFNHHRYHNLCNDLTKNIVLCKGWAGTGKTIVMCYYAAKRLQSGKIDRIVVTRSLEGVGKDPGAYRGDAYEKNEPKLRGLMNYISCFTGKSIESLIFQGKLVVQGLADIQGQDFTGAWLLVTECQTLTDEQMYQVITRGAEKVILEGDTCPAQLTNNKIAIGEDGLTFLMETIGDLDFVGIVDMCNDEDIVRKEYMKQIIKRMMPALEERRIKRQSAGMAKYR